MVVLLGYLWASPNTAVGFALAILAFRRGRFAWANGVLEVTGGGVASLLRRIPMGGRVLALTLGHVILAIDDATLDEVRDHERVHVRQFAWWGPFFLPAYLVASLIALAARRDPYRENAFERAAFRPTSSAPRPRPASRSLPPV